MKIFVVYSVPEHCGHEVVSRIFLDKEEAQIYCDKVNQEWYDYWGSWDGSQSAVDMKTKEFKNNVIEDLDGNCDICGYECNCNHRKIWKTEREYHAHWAEIIKNEQQSKPGVEHE